MFHVDDGCPNLMTDSDSNQTKLSRENHSEENAQPFNNNRAEIENKESLSGNEPAPPSPIPTASRLISPSPSSPCPSPSPLPPISSTLSALSALPFAPVYYPTI